jgi:hypothetical protein
VGSGSGMTEMSKSPTFTRLLKIIPKSIINADREEHQRLRRALAHGFSDQSMREQEPVILQYADLLIRRIRENGKDGQLALNATRWYNWTTFDIVGHLVFAESFGCLTGSEYHPWVANLFKAIRIFTSLLCLKYLGLSALVDLSASLGATATQTKLRKVNRDMIIRRLAVEKGQEDLFEGVVKHREEWVSCSLGHVSYHLGH